MSRNGRSDKELFFKNFYPLASWDILFEFTKKNSVYYEMLTKSHGKDFADHCWDQRADLLNEQARVDSVEQLYQAVKDYKPRNPLCLIGDFNWGYNVIKEKGLNKPKE